MYIGNKIRDKYNSEFGLNGETIYLTSDIKRREFREIDQNNPKIMYAGNVRLGRNDSLVDIGNALQKISKDYYVDVYSTEQNEEFLKGFKECLGLRFHGSVPYVEIMKLTSECDISIIVEGFKKKDVDTTRYSLSTKAADAIASGSNIFVYGSKECGVIEYMESTGCAMVCSNKDELVDKLKELIGNKTLQKKLYDRAIEVDIEDHVNSGYEG